MSQPFGFRRDWSPRHWRIRSKIVALVLLVILVSVAALTGYSYYALSSSIVQQTGEGLVVIGREAIQRAGDSVAASAAPLKALALSPSIIELVETANQTYAGRDQAQLRAEIDKLDKAWKDKDPSVEELTATIANNPVSAQLRSFLQTFPDQVEVFVTDVQGLNVAMTDRTSDYLQSDEGWWQNAYNNGQGARYVGEVEYDASTQTYAMNIGVPVRDREGQKVIGVLRGTVNISVVFRGLSELRVGASGRSILLNREGIMLYTDQADQLMQPAPEHLASLLEAPEPGWRSDLPDLEGDPALIAYRPLQGELASALGWTILLSQDLNEVYIPVQRSLVGSLVTAVVLAVLLAGLGIWVAGSIANPLVVTTRLARQLALGDVSPDVAQATAGFDGRRDEAGELARAFAELRRYISLMAVSAERLANNDLTIEVQPLGNKDVLGNAFARMIVNLRASVGQVAESARRVNTAAGQLAQAAQQAGQATSQIAATMQQVARATGQQNETMTRAVASVDHMSRAIEGVARGAQEQATAVNKASALTAQITAAIQQVAASAEVGARSSAQAAHAAQAGAQIVEQTVQGMTTIKAKVGLSTQKVAEMGQHSDQIGAIVETIDDIASQTNLLALNAAIEAARAGEHGKGFAVVADEVRKLAEKATAATKEIASLIQGIQRTIAEAVQAMHEGASEVETGATRANQAGSALASILEAAAAVQKQVNDIAAAAQHISESSSELVAATEAVSAVVEENSDATTAMANGAAQVGQAIDNIAGISQENSAAVQEVSAATEQMTAQVEGVTASAQALSQLAYELQQVVDRFRLDS